MDKSVRSEGIHEIGENGNEVWQWEGQDYCLEKNSNFNISKCLWDGVPQNEEDLSYMFDETTPIKACGDLAYNRWQLRRKTLSCSDRATKKTKEKKEEKSVSMATSPKACPSQLVVLNKAFKLAEHWVNNMSSSLADEPNEAKLEARPSRLGLGAKVSRQSKIGPSNDPIERKLYAKLDVGKRNSVNSGIKDYAPSARNGSDNSDDSDEDLESRTKSFGKKRVVPSSSSPQINKKRK